MMKTGMFAMEQLLRNSEDRTSEGQTCAGRLLNMLCGFYFKSKGK